MRAGRLLATDLDRTLLPNGAAPEAPEARPLFAEFVQRRGLEVAYVTGRRLELVREAIAQYDVPEPDWILADVGSSLYHRTTPGTWSPSTEWADHLAADWRGRTGPELAPLIAAEPGLELQEDAAQRPFKLSFYASRDLEEESLRERLGAALEREQLRSVVVYSVDEARDVGLVDVLPARSSKLRALEFVTRKGALTAEETMFAGDSGNDLEVLLSEIPGVLVANADADLRQRVQEAAGARGVSATVHLAQGGVAGMNGNYAAGVLEGWTHFHPEDLPLLLELAATLRMDRPAGGSP